MDSDRTSTRRHRVLSTLIATLVAIGTWASPAYSAPSAEDKETARALMQKADSLYDAKNFKAALEAYQGAEAIMHVSSTGLGVARALAALGRLVEAKAMAQQVASMSPEPDEPQAFTRARADAAQLVKELSARIPSLQIAFRGVPAGAEVRLEVDGQTRKREDFASPRELDPGPHNIVATTGGAKSSSAITLKEGETRTVTLAVSLTSQQESSTGSVKPSGGSTRRTLGFVALGVGGAGLATAGVTGVILLSRDSKIKDDCPDKRCNPEGRDLIEGSKSLIVVNAVAFGVGVVGAGLGTYLLLTSGSKEAPIQTTFSPMYLPGGGALSVRRSF